MKRLFGALFLFGVIANLVFAQQLALPYSNYNSGYYTGTISVSLSHITPGVSIYYTLNGDEPDETDMLFATPLDMTDLSGFSNYYSMIPTNPSFTYPIGTYTATRANTRGWLPPFNEVQKTNILRYRAYKPGFEPSEIVTQTFFMHPAGPSLYNLPVLSLVFDSYDLFSDDSGIYVYGNHPDGNYTQTGSLWEKFGHLEYFNESGDLVLSGNIDARLHGNGSRSSCKKNFRLYADDTQSGNFDYNFFEDYDLEKFKRIIVRSGGHRPDCFPRDDLGSMLTKGLSVDQQNLQNVILFVNGEYWGIHSIKERIDRYFIQNRYNIDDNDITILSPAYNVIDGYLADSDEMKAIADFAISSVMTDAANYKWVTDRIDIDNYIDYMSSEIFLSNADWVYSNVMVWKKNGPYDDSKPKGHDGKYRWILFDLDGAFGGVCDNPYYTVNTLEAATITTGPDTLFSRLFRGLLNNPDFRQKFINRTCDLMNSQFRQNRMFEKITEIYNLLTPELMRDVERWRYPSVADNLADRALETPSLTQWDYSFSQLYLFGNRRQRKMRDHIMAKWGYPDSSLVTANVNDVNMGMVQVNSILINQDLKGVSAGVYPWTGYYINTVSLPLIAVPLPGYRFVEWQETGITDDTITWNPLGNETFTAIFEPAPTYSSVVINEVMSSNSSFIADNFDEFDDWVELFNPNNYPINLSGCVFQRGTSIWTIPQGAVLAANGYSIFWNDSQTYQGENHTNFNLPNSPNTIYLRHPNLQIIDSLYFPATSTNYSFGRYPNGSNNYVVFNAPTPLVSNDLSKIDEQNLVSLSGFPNPTNGNFHLSKSIDFNLYDLQGNVMLSGSNQSVISTDKLANGVYILVSSDLEKLKIVVQR